MALNTFIILGNYVFSKLFHQDFPGSPVARTRRSQCRGPRLDPWSYNYIPYAAAEDSAWHDLRSCMLQWRLKILHAITKTQCSQIHKLKKKKKNLFINQKTQTLYPLSSDSSFLQSLVTSAFVCLYEFALYLLHQSGIICYLSFCVGFLSLSRMFSRFIHAVAQAFLWLINISLSV